MNRRRFTTSVVAASFGYGTQLLNKGLAYKHGNLQSEEATQVLATNAIVVDVELQPLVVQAKRLIEAMESLGSPFTPGHLVSLQRLFQKTGAGPTSDAVVRIQNILDSYVLVHVTINPESRVSVNRGSALPILNEGGWRIFLVKVINDSGLTARLRVESPQALPVSGHSPGSDITATGVVSAGASRPIQSITLADVADCWLDVTMFDSPPLTPELSGLKLEYRILQLYSRDRGKREARLSFNAGPTTKDLGFRNEVAILFTCRSASKILLSIRDADGESATASLLITDEQGRIYPARAKRLAPDFSFQSQIYRKDGESIFLPGGSYTVEYSRGPEYLKRKQKFQIPENSGLRRLEIRLERWFFSAQYGWYSGDHHIHAAGCAHYNTPEEGVSPEELAPQIRGEGLDVGEVLSWGPSWYHQKQFFTGTVNRASNSNTLLRYDVEVSGFPSSYWGHLALLGLKEQDFPGAKRIEDWPTWNLPVLKWAKAQGAITGYAHTGHGLVVESNEVPNYLIPKFNDNGANEFLMDLAHGAVDFLSAIDTPPASELNIWYHVLNCGFRIPISGETDFPCLFGRVGVGRSYVHLATRPQGESGYRAWIDGLKNGRSYVSDGRSHLIDIRVGNVELGVANELRIDSPAPVRITAKVAAYLDETPSDESQKIRASAADHSPYWHIERARIEGTREVLLELIVNGRRAGSQKIPANSELTPVEFTTPIDRSSWIALRVLPSSHSNPVYITVGGKPFSASAKSCQWCLDCIEAAWERLGPRIANSEQKTALVAFEHARSRFKAILSVDGTSAIPE